MALRRNPQIALPEFDRRERLARRHVLFFQCVLACAVVEHIAMETIPQLFETLAVYSANCSLLGNRVYGDEIFLLTDSVGLIEPARCMDDANATGLEITLAYVTMPVEGFVILEAVALAAVV